MDDDKKIDNTDINTVSPSDTSVGAAVTPETQIEDLKDIEQEIEKEMQSIGGGVSTAGSPFQSAGNKDDGRVHDEIDSLKKTRGKAESRIKSMEEKIKSDLSSLRAKKDIIEKDLGRVNEFKGMVEKIKSMEGSIQSLEI